MKLAMYARWIKVQYFLEGKIRIDQTVYETVLLFQFPTDKYFADK